MTTQRRDALVLVAIVAVAALVRLVNLPARGRWDDDQGEHLLAVRGWVMDGAVPLVGPPSSLGEAHHGALYYWLLAPTAWLTNVDPVAAVLVVLVAGLVGVIATWVLARMVGGAAAGHAAGIFAALSPAWVESSTFLWNPNLVAPGAAIAAAGAWLAWQRRAPRWWILATVGLVLAVQGHLLAALVVPPYLVLLVLDARRRPAPDARADDGALRPRRPFGPSIVASAVVVLVGFAPLIVHEVTTGLGETRAILDFLVARDGGGGADVAGRLAVGLLRSLSWPLAGLLTIAPLAALGAVALAVAAIAWRLLAGRGDERAFVAWTTGTIAWTVLALAVVAPGIAVVVPELPTDHYHATLDPLVLAVVALAIAALWRPGRPPLRAGAAVLLAAAVAVGVPAWPPLTASDGGWPAARDAAARVAVHVGDRPTAVLPLPDIKTGDAIRFPLARLGVEPVDPAAAAAIVVVCDPVFEAAIGAPCGGGAEDALIDRLDRPGLRMVERIDGGPRRIVSVYLAEP